MSRLPIALALVCALGACTAGEPEPSADVFVPETTLWVSVDKDEVPWTFDAPADWFVTVNRSRPDPNFKTGVLQTWLGTAKYQRGWWLGPNGGSGASARLGRDGVMVNVELYWYPPDKPIRWSPEPDTELRLERDWGSHEDNQNPGWTFHEQHLCQGRECIGVLTWYGPDASDADIANAERVKESLELLTNWTD